MKRHLTKNTDDIGEIQYSKTGLNGTFAKNKSKFCSREAFFWIGFSALCIALAALFSVCVVCVVQLFLLSNGYPCDECWRDYLAGSISSVAGLSVAIWSLIQLWNLRQHDFIFGHEKALDYRKYFDSIGGIDLCFFFGNVAGKAINFYNEQKKNLYKLQIPNDLGNLSNDELRSTFLWLSLIHFVCEYRHFAKSFFSEAFMKELKDPFEGDINDGPNHFCLKYEDSKVKYISESIDISLTRLTSFFRLITKGIVDARVDRKEVDYILVSFQNAFPEVFTFVEMSKALNSTSKTGNGKIDEEVPS